MIIVPYGAYYTDTNTIFGLARVLEKQPPNHLQPASLWKQLRRSIFSFATNEIRDTTISVTYADHTTQFTSDHEGYLHVNMPILQMPKSHALIHYHNVGETVSDPVFYSNDPEAPIIITDIDDTILRTDVHSKIRMMYKSLLLSPQSRQSVKGSAAFLQHHTSKGHLLFYLSNSPYNLYDYLKTYLQVEGFPEGVILLRDFGKHMLRRRPLMVKNKWLQLTRIANEFPNRKLILIGDAAEDDPKLFGMMKDQYPNREITILLRRTGRSHRDMAAYDLLKHYDQVSLFDDFESLL